MRCFPGGTAFCHHPERNLKGGDFSVSVPAASEEGGAQANAAAETIKLVLVTPPPGVTAVTNRDAFTGGADGESDEELRERVLESCRNIPNGTNSAFTGICLCNMRACIRRRYRPEPEARAR